MKDYVSIQVWIFLYYIKQDLNAQKPKKCLIGRRKERRVGGFRERKKFDMPYFWPLCFIKTFLVVVAATGWRGTSWPPTCWAWTPTYTSCGSSYRMKGHILAPYLLSKTTNKQKCHVSSYCEHFQHLATMTLGNRLFNYTTSYAADTWQWKKLGSWTDQNVLLAETHNWWFQQQSS